MEPRIIKTPAQYRRYLDEVARLAAGDPDADTDDGARLELLAKLVEDFEKARFPFAHPDPVEAILFRMEQQGLRQKDIAGLLGGKNRASEILARKRPLTLSMIRALHERLAIPSDLLIREPAATYDVAEDVSETDVRRWLSRVREVANARAAVHRRFHPENLNEDVLKYVARLSWMDHGPRLAKEFLEERGIAMVIEPHPPSTHLDGAALLGRSGVPVIALTIREDRLDSFWFTLMHELVHAWKDLNDDRRAIADENIGQSDPAETLERETNERAREILVPRSVWRRSEAFRKPSAKAIVALAAELQISPAIVAGRVRHERGDFSLFTGLIGLRQVRRLFPDVKWKNNE